MHRATTTLYGLLVVLLTASVIGCGSGREMVPVSGTVLVDGEPLTTGTVMVAPEDDRAAFGQIGADGRFTLTTFKEGDGCIKGTHRATVNAAELINPNQIRLLVPEHYSEVSQSDLTVTIEGPTDGLVIELSWEGERKKIIRTQTAGDVDPSSM